MRNKKSSLANELSLFLLHGFTLDDFNNLQFLNSLTKAELTEWAKELEVVDLFYAHTLLEMDILAKLDKVNTIGLAQHVLEPLMEKAKDGQPTVEKSVDTKPTKRTITLPKSKRKGSASEGEAEST